MVKIKLLKELFFIGVIFFFGCQQKPTKTIQESANAFSSNVVLLDTRNALDFESFHIEGAQALRSEDFLVLKNPRAKQIKYKKALDSDLNQIVERLARKGVAPMKTIFLIGDKKNSIENKKWRWLLSYLEIEDVQMFSLEEIRKMKFGRFSEPEKQSPWLLRSSEDFKKEFIFKKAPDCFVTWSEKNCR